MSGTRLQPTTLQPTTRQNPGCTQRRGMWRVEGGGGGDAMPLDGYFRWRTSVFLFASLFDLMSGIGLLFGIVMANAHVDSQEVIHGGCIMQNV